MPPLCVYHSPCADGFTAAWVVKLAIPNCEFVPGKYGKEIDLGLIAGRNVIMVDFSVKKAVLEKWNKLAASVLVLDHHKTAQEDLAGYMQAPPFPEWRKIAWGDQPLAPGSRVAVQFDMERSGAQMAWDYFNVGAQRPALVNYVGDRDLWKFAMPSSRLVNAYVFSYDYTFSDWDSLYQRLSTPDGVREAAGFGAAIERKHHKDVGELLAETQRTMIIGGREVPVSNIPYTMASDAGQIMAHKHPSKMAATYFDGPKGRTFSLRSTVEGPDVAVIAASYGGGGHKNASGFLMPAGWEGEPRGG